MNLKYGEIEMSGDNFISSDLLGRLKLLGTDHGTSTSQSSDLGEGYGQTQGNGMLSELSKLTSRLVPTLIPSKAKAEFLPSGKKLSSHSHTSTILRRVHQHHSEGSCDMPPAFLPSVFKFLLLYTRLRQHLCHGLSRNSKSDFEDLW